MPLRALLPVLCVALGGIAFGMAVFHERRMQRHRQPAVSYREVTWRLDGGWRRPDLFTAEGLRHQRRASAFGLTGTALWMAALAAWALLAR